MSKSSLAIAVICSLLAVSVSANAPAQVETYQYLDKDHLNWYFAMARGAIQGMQRGLYKKTTYATSDQCLGNDTVTNLMKLADAYEHGGTSELFGQFSAMYQVLYKFEKFCDLKTVPHDVIVFCVKNDCGWSTLLQNLLGKVF